MGQQPDHSPCAAIDLHRLARQAPISAGVGEFAGIDVYITPSNGKQFGLSATRIQTGNHQRSDMSAWPIVGEREQQAFFFVTA